MGLDVVALRRWLRRLQGSSRSQAGALVTAAAMVLAGGGLVAWSDAAAGQAASAYHHQRQLLSARLQADARLGYTSRDLAPITGQLEAMDRSSPPWWIPGRPGYFDGLARQAAALQGRLRTLERQVLDRARSDAAREIAAGRSEVNQDQQIGAADPDLQSLQQRLDAAAQADASARTLRDYRNALQQAQGVVRDATALYAQTQQENQAVQQAAQQLLAQDGGNLAAIQQAGQQAIAAGRNDASVVAYMNVSKPFPDEAAVARAISRLEHFAPLVASADVNQAALGAAGVERYAAQIHQAFIAGLPPKAIVVSFQAQHLWAYQNGQVVMDTPVTTGIRGVGDIGTDFGPMKVLFKSHPWTMHSPWPPGSPYWYPDTVVQWATFFTNTGESIHDAYWEPDSELGPGSQYDPSTRSHGCIHVPYADAQWVFNWAEVGMPVIVYPGDGTPVANQLAQITTDSQGNPKGIP
ncbi:MAG TPA: L,D-transpeptidase [Candidatus Dormibacteraeota bacterium]|nr:L,D-transpeptidase [Candidatus Dormibacteraeota bacterium]